MDEVNVNIVSVLNRVIGEITAVRDALNTVGTQPTSTNSAMVSASQISAAAYQWANGNPNAFGINGFLGGAEWMRQKLHQ